ncbi:MAG: hypothetical protein KF720_14290 [Rubrivivax sp.]|nr:hypothetical protein [Rubrivivax sp.]
MRNTARPATPDVSTTTAFPAAAAQGRFSLVDYEKAYCPDLKNGPDICPARRRPRQGAIVVVRPDQYVANMPPLDVYDELTAFFAGFLLDRK